ncbi:MAG: PQQ-binding-like beta-propeller repeat protein [Pirellulaceae bacterium]
MADHQDSEQDTTAEPLRSPRIVPPLGVLIPAIFFLLLAIFGLNLQTLLEGPLAPLAVKVPVMTDPTFGNLMTLIGGFFTLFIPMVWFAIGSGFTLPVRLMPIVGFALLVGGFFALFEIRSVSGSLVPKFAYRFSPADDAQLADLELTGRDDESETLETTPDDFPQFLGPGRDLRIETVQLNPDWENHPPQELWRRPIGAGWSGFSVVGGLAFTMEQRGPEERVTCYRAADGQPVWSHATETRHETTMGFVGPRCTPLIHQSKVYTQGGTGVVLCLSATTGEEIWKHDLLELMNLSAAQEANQIAWGRAGSPLLYALEDRDLIVLPAGGPTGATVSLVAFDAESGEVVWKGGDQQISYVSPSVARIEGQDQIISVNEATITGHDPATGTELWRTDWPGSSSGNASCSQVHDLGDNRLLVTKGYGQGTRVFKVVPQAENGFETVIVWEDHRIFKTKFTNVAVANGWIYGLNDGILERVDLETQKRQWRKRGFDYGQILLVGDVLLVMSEDGRLAAVNATSEKFQELGSLQALVGKNSPTWNNLCLFGDKLLVRNAEEAACYQLKLK